MSKPAAIYCRISDDREGREAGVRRQEDDCRALAGRLGYEVDETAVYVENDRGASRLSRKPRPKYDALMRRARAGEFSAILVYSSSRLTRNPKQHEQIIDLVEATGMRIETANAGPVDYNTAQGRANARNRATWDALEAEQTGERVQRAARQMAEEGRRHGRVPLGWMLDTDGNEVLDPVAAPIIESAARRVLGGESIRSVAVGLNAQGFRRAGGSEWTPQTLRRVLKREANAGRRTYEGTTYQAQWPPLYDPQIHDRLVRLLSEPGRGHGRPTAIKYLLSGIVTCGKPGCGKPLRVAVDHKRGRKPAYQCGTCFGARRNVELVDATVTAVLIARLTREDAADLLGGDATVAAEAEAQAQAFEARLARYAEDLVTDRITEAQFYTLTNALRPRLDEARDRARGAMPGPDLARFAGDGARAAWESATLPEKRALLRQVLDVVLLPSGPGVPFDPVQHLRIDWRH